MLAEGRNEEVWGKYCGFLDLNLEQFMQIQKRLLQEQMQLLSNCELGQQLLGGQTPKSIAEFRQIAPLTTYKDYLDYLPTKREDALPAKPKVWMRTSGRTGEFSGKWVPCSEEFYAQISSFLVGAAILASARFKGDIRLSEQDTFLYTVAPPPYFSGIAIHAAGDGEFPFQYVPSIAEAETMSFQERLEEGFSQSLETGIGYFMGVASVLLRIGESFAGDSERSMSIRTLLRPKILFRLGRGFLNSKLQKRDILPRDIWTPKGIVASGTDVQVYKQRIKTLWGIMPLEAYGCTEFGGVAWQSWGARSKGLTMSPDSAFWEFIPEDEYNTWKLNLDYKPKTLVFDQLTPGRYVLVGTSFNGGAFIRYILGDLISVISLNDENAGIQLPQIVVESRVDDVIDMVGMVILTERAVWRAIGEMGLPNMDWILRKEYNNEINEPFLSFYVEDMDRTPEDLATDLHNVFISCIDDYSTYYDFMQKNPIKVTMLSPGTFIAYFKQMEAEHADPGHFKPPRMQSSDEVMARLTHISAEIAES